MSDKLTVALALVPLCSGVILVGILQRPVARSLAPQHVPTPMSAVRPSERSPEDEHQRFPGVVIAAQSAEMAAESDGRVARVWARSGARLKRGQPILEIDRSDVNTGIASASAERDQRRSEEARAEARKARARDMLARLENGGAWLSAQELESARSELRVAEAELAAARSATAMSLVRLRQVHLRAARHVISAPFDGVLVSSELDVGDSVAAGQVLARVLSDERRVRFGMPREYVPRKGAQMEVTLQVGERSARIPAKVIDVRPELDPAAQLVIATALPPPEASMESDWVLGARVIVRPTQRVVAVDPER